MLSFLSNNLGVNSNKEKHAVCEICFRVKQTRGKFSVIHNKANSIFELLYCDIWGPYKKSSSHYFLTIVDDAAWATWVYLMHEKGATNQLFKNFIIMTHTQFGKSVNAVRSDNGSEFTFIPMQIFYQEKGILRQSSCADTS